MTVTLHDIKRIATFEKIYSEIDFFVQAKVKDSKHRVAIASDDEDEEDSEIDSEQETEEEDEERDEETVFRKMLFGLKEFNLLTEKISFDTPGWLIKLDLFDGMLHVRSVPSDPHGCSNSDFFRVDNYLGSRS